MKFAIVPLCCCFLIPPVFANEKADIQKEAAPTTPHALSETEHASEEAQTATAQEAKTMRDGALIVLRGHLIQDKGGDIFVLRDDSGTIDTLIPVSLLGGQAVKTDRIMTLTGSLDTKTQPPIVRVNKVEQ